MIADGETVNLTEDVSVSVTKNTDGTYEVTVSGGKVAEFPRWCWPLDSVGSVLYDTGCTLDEFSKSGFTWIHEVSASAGEDIIVDGGGTVTLDGSQSVVPDETQATFTWSEDQNNGASVVLSNANTNTASFTTPQATGSDLVLSFKLSISYGLRTEEDTVQVTIRATNVPNTKSCSITNGAGTQQYDTTANSWGACSVSNCDSGYHQDGNTCVSNTRNCSVTNGAGTQQYDTTANSWGACSVSNCDSGYHQDGNTCVSNTRNCSVTNGAGTQQYDTTANSWRACSVSNCDSGYHQDGNTCVSNTRNCSVTNGAGTQQYDTTTNSWGACSVSNCDSGYHQDGNTCVPNTKSCSVTNGAGTQQYDTTANSWGALLRLKL